MAVFNEYFPSQSDALMKFIENQKKLEAISNALKQEQPEISERKSVYEIWSDSFKMMFDETEKSMRESEERDIEIQKIHDSIENIDDITYCVENPIEFGKFEGEGRVVDTSSITKRVFHLEDDEEASNKRISITPEIRQTRASLLKSKFTAAKHNFQSRTQSAKSFNTITIEDDRVSQKSSETFIIDEESVESEIYQEADDDQQFIQTLQESENSSNTSENYEKTLQSTPCKEEVVENRKSLATMSNEFLKAPQKSFIIEKKPKLKSTIKKLPYKEPKISDSVRKTLDAIKEKQKAKQFKTSTPLNVVNLQFF